MEYNPIESLLPLSPPLWSLTLTLILILGSGGGDEEEVHDRLSFGY
jgi:hypothetical protein